MKRRIQSVVRMAQKILITFLLTIIYFAGFGLTLIFMLIFKRRHLQNSAKEKTTFWIEAEGYNPDIEDSYRQS